jgi:hypothetical protein
MMGLHCMGCWGACDLHDYLLIATEYLALGVNAMGATHLKLILGRAGLMGRFLCHVACWFISAAEALYSTMGFVP